MRLGIHFWQLQAALVIFSLTSVIAKIASSASFPSIQFLALYGAQLMLFFGYAIFWQRILKKIDLSIAYTSKGITLIWSLLWAVIIFNETVTTANLIGSSLVILGIVLISRE